MRWRGGAATRPCGRAKSAWPWRRTPPGRGCGAWTTAPVSSGSRTGRGRSSASRPDEVVTMERFEACVHPDDLDLVRRTIERSTRAADELAYAEYRIQSSDGSVRWVASRGRPRSTSGGRPDRLMGVTIDISDRRRAQEELRASEARLEAGVELAGLAFYEVDFGAGVVYVDDRFRDLCGVPPDREQGLAGPGVLDGASASRRPPHVCWTSAGSCTTGGWNGSSSSIASCTRAKGRSGSSTSPASPRATPPDARSSRTASSATSPSASAPRTSCTT